MNIDNLLEEIHNDISFTDEDLENIKTSTTRHINEELEKINKYLEQSVLDFTTKQIENLKQLKIDRLSKHINTITEQTLIKVSDEFNLDKDSVLEKNKDNLLQINNYQQLYNPENPLLDLNNINEIPIKETISVKEETISVKEETISVKEETTTKKKNKKEKKDKKDKKDKLDNTTENDAYKTYLISQHKCPAFVKEKYCEKPPKHGHYCGYHKALNV